MDVDNFNEGDIEGIAKALAKALNFTATTFITIEEDFAKYLAQCRDITFDHKEIDDHLQGYSNDDLLAFAMQT
jgi:hypothetical protein